MLPFFRIGRNYNIEPEELFNLYIELGSLKKVVANLAGRGIVSEKTGEPFKTLVISKMIWTWIIQDYKYPYKIIKDKGYNVSEKYWEQFCVSKAYSFFVTANHNKERYYAWIDKNKLDPKYKEYKRQKPFKDL